MALTKKQKELGAALLNNLGNITLSISEVDVKLYDFNQWIQIPEFKEIYDTAIQAQRDSVDAQFMALVDDGDARAIIEYKKIQRQTADEVSLKKLQKEMMRILIQLADTKTICLKEYCAVFNASQKMAEKQYTSVIAEYNLQSPYERQQEIKKKKDSMLSTLFESGKLSELEMYSKMLAIALHDSENSEYASERSRAMDKVIQINQRLEEINDRMRRESESDESNLIDKCDALFFGASIASCERIRHELISDNVKAIEDASDT